METRCSGIFEFEFEFRIGFELNNKEVYLDSFQIRA